MRTGRCSALAAIVLAIAAAACARRAAPAESGAGEWRGSDGNLDVRMSLVIAGDSVAGEGTYTLRDPAQLGCGGETLPRTGRVSLAGARSAGQFGGRFHFVEGGWTPPYSGAFIAPDTLNGAFMSVDRGRCPLTLVRRR